METLETKCPICYDDYNLSEKQPRMWPTCGHTLCQACLSALIKDQRTSKCPLDKKELSHGSNIEEFPVNYALKAVVDVRIRTQKNSCAVHGEEFISVCIVDRCKVCAVCLEVEHHGHQTRALKTINSQLTDGKKQIAELSQQMTESHKKAEEVIDSKLNLQLGKIDAHYDELFELLSYKKQCLKAQTNLLYNIEKNKIGDLVGQESALFQDVSAKELSLQNIQEPEKLFNIGPEIRSLKDQYEHIANPNFLMQSIREPSRQAEQAIDEVFINNKAFFEQSEAILTERLDLRVVQTHLLIEERPQWLCIDGLSKAVRKMKIDLEKWAEMTIFWLDIDQNISIQDLSLLAFIWDNLSSVSALRLSFALYTLTKELCNIFCNNWHKLKEIEINISDCKSNDVDKQNIVIPFMQKIFSNSKDIETVSLNVMFNNSEKNWIGKVFERHIFDTTNLQIFSLIITGGAITDEDTKFLFVKMPKLREFTVWLNNSTISDEALISCAQNTLKSASLIESVNLSFANTRVTDIGVEHLCRNLQTQKLDHLQLDLQETQITSKSVGTLIQLFSKNNFKATKGRFLLDLSRTKVLNKSLVELFKFLPNASCFTLGLNELKINDITIQRLIEYYLGSVNTLSSLELKLSDSKITEEGFIQLFKSLNNSKTIVLNLNNTVITDAVLEPFIDEKLSSDSVCRDLSIQLDGTAVSKSLKGKIKRFNELKILKH